MKTQTITIEVPADFNAEQIKEVQEFAMVKVERILRATEVVPVEIKEANDTKIDECLVAMELPTKFAKVEIPDDGSGITGEGTIEIIK